MNFAVVLCVLLFALSASAQYGGGSVPQYNQQVYLQQALTPVRQGPQTFEGARSAPPRPQPQQPPPQYVLQGQRQPIQQILLPSAVDRQVQRVAQQVAGRDYAQQIQQAQLQAQAQEAIAAAQRKQTSQTFAGRIQPIPVPQAQPAQQQQQPQYLRPERPQLYYAPQVQSEPQPSYRPQAAGLEQREKQEQQIDEEYDSNPNYQFGFDVKDDLYTNYQNRKEQREGDKTSGSYSVVDSDGFVRTVKYTADPKEGFKAEVTREPTNIVVKIPKPIEQIRQRQPTQQYVQAVPQKEAGPELEQQNDYYYQYQ